MMWNPFRQTEHRESSFTDALVAQIVAQSGVQSSARATATGALESASGLVARCFASATVEGPAHLSAAITPALLSTVGRALVRCGELVALIEVDVDGRVRLSTAATWDVQGGPNPASWLYRLSLPGPSTTLTHPSVPATDVVHLRWAVDTDQPWKGVGPLASASLAGRLSAETAAALADGESGPRGSILPLPIDGADPTVEPLKADIRNLAGKLAFVESDAHHDTCRSAANAPRGDWDSRSGSGRIRRRPRWS